MDFASKIHARGHPRAACEPPVFSDNSRPGREGIGFRPLRWATKGVAFGNHKLLKKLDQNFYFPEPGAAR